MCQVKTQNKFNHWVLILCATPKKAAVESHPTVCATSKIVGHIMPQKRDNFRRVHKITKSDY